MAGETILVVEDESIIALHLQRMLVNFGYQVPLTVPSGMAAIRAVGQVKPDLILMDIKLQGNMNGIETAHQIHENYDLPVVYLTAFVEDARLVEACKTEPYGYLAKPVQERELHATISMALYKHQIDQRLKESEVLYREMYHDTPVMLQLADACGVILQISDYWLSVFGYERDEVIGRHNSDFFASGNSDIYLHGMTSDFDRTGFVHDAEIQLLKKNGEPIDILLNTRGVYDDYGQIIKALSAMVDISGRKQAEAAERDQRVLAEALRDSAAALNMTLSLNQVLENILDNVGRVVRFDAVNVMLVEDEVARIVRCRGYHEQPQEEAAMSVRLPVSEQPHLCKMAETGRPLIIADTAQVEGWRDPWITSYSGAPVIFQDHLVGFINLIGLQPNFFTSEQAERLQAFANQAAIAIENARLYAEVERLATLDDVTGVFNRRRLFELGTREFERAKRYDSPLSAILIDIDRFKKINDTFGHNTGDQVLASLAAMINRSIREVDLFGRYGGEEFVVLLPQTTQSRAADVADRLRKLVAEYNFETERAPISVTISLGVAEYHPALPSLAALIDRADQAMYAAKQAGRNRVELYKF